MNRFSPRAISGALNAAICSFVPWEKLITSKMV